VRDSSPPRRSRHSASRRLGWADHRKRDLVAPPVSPDLAPRSSATNPFAQNRLRRARAQTPSASEEQPRVVRREALRDPPTCFAWATADARPRRGRGIETVVDRFRAVPRLSAAQPALFVVSARKRRFVSHRRSIDSRRDLLEAPARPRGRRIHELARGLRTQGAARRRGSSSPRHARPPGRFSIVAKCPLGPPPTTPAAAVRPRPGQSLRRPRRAFCDLRDVAKTFSRSLRRLAFRVRLNSVGVFDECAELCEPAPRTPHALLSFRQLAHPRARSTRGAPPLRRPTVHSR